MNLTEQLTTPKLKNIDSTFPGENWFFYWKTSASLWKQKIEEHPYGGKIVIPVNWSFHSDTGESFDFGDYRPETDLKRLVDCIEKAGRRPLFLIPLGPVPYLPNGGIPHLLAKTVATDKDGVGKAVIDSTGSIHKLYSFFEPRVFQCFRKFCSQLGQYISSKGLPVDVWGMVPGHFNEEGQFVEFIEDSSRAFDQGFARYMQVKQEEEGSSDFQISDMPFFQEEYTRTIKSLYLETAKDAFPGHFEGTLDTVFMGASVVDFFERIHDKQDEVAYGRQLFYSISEDLIPSTVLLGNRDYTSPIEKQSKNIIVESYFPQKVDTILYEEDELKTFRPLNFFEILETKFIDCELSWKSLGLITYLETEYDFNYKRNHQEIFKWTEGQENMEKVYFFQGQDMNKGHVYSIFKIFMNGGRVVINKCGIEDTLLKQLEVFFIENNLNRNRFHFGATVDFIELGEGKIILFDSENFQDEIKSPSEFWSKIFSIFSITNVEMEKDDGILSFWLHKFASGDDLNFEEIRRLSLFNPTSYKRKMKIKYRKNFALTKIVDEINAKVQTRPGEIEIDFLPRSSLNLDFGVFY